MVHDQVSYNMQLNQESMEQNLNGGVNPQTYEIGDLILLHRDAFFSSVKYKKLTDVYYGPYKLVAKKNANAFELDFRNESAKHPVINTRYFRPYKSVNQFLDTPPWKLYDMIQKADRINGILGYDLEEGVIDVLWSGCNPAHGTRVSVEWFNKFVPRILRDSLIANVRNLQRNNGVVEEQRIAGAGETEIQRSNE